MLHFKRGQVAREADARKGVGWLLLTTDSVQAQVVTEQVLRCYRLLWRVENCPLVFKSG